jgi:hypothetical protein
MKDIIKITAIVFTFILLILFIWICLRIGDEYDICYREHKFYLITYNKCL